jgi:hypothetical protein
MRFLEGTICATAGLAILALAPSANAQTYGQAITPGGGTVTLVAGNDLTTTVPGAGSTLVGNTGVTNYDSGNQSGNRLVGTYISEVYQETGGNLDFYYQFTVDSGSTGPASTFGTSNFKPVSSAVGFTTSAVGSTSASTYAAGGPNSASESNGGVSDTITFDFTSLGGGGVSTGARSVTLLVSTTSQTFTTNNASLQGGATANFAVFAPANASGASAPEPGALALVIPGVLGMVGMARRRKTA